MKKFFIAFASLAFLVTATPVSAYSYTIDRSDYTYSGSVGDEITIYYSGNDCGSDTSSTARVSINGTSIGYDDWYQCIGQVNVTIPNHASSGVITIVDHEGNPENVGSFTFLKAPTVSSISPKYAVPGETKMKIRGNNFGDTFYEDTLYLQDASGVYEVDTVKSWTDTEITFLLPSYMDAGRIGIRRHYSGKGNSDFSYSDYYYLQPQITSISSNEGAEGDSVLIYGDHLADMYPSDMDADSTLQVYFGGEPIGADNITTWKDTYILAKVPSWAKSGKLSIKITNKPLGEVVTVEAPDDFSALKPTANDPLSAYQKYIKRVNIDDAWNYSTGSSDVVVAVIDSGIYIHHPDLKENIWKNTGEVEGNGIDDDNNGYVDDIFGWNFVDDNNRMDITFDKDDHGTMVAGIIGAKHDNGIGISGINKSVKLMPLLILSKYSHADYDGVAESIRYAVDNGADIINLSFGTQGTVGYTTAFDDAIKYAHDNNVLLVAAAGNGDLETGRGIDLDFVKESPVANDNGRNLVLGVGALNENSDTRPSWSNYGSYVDIWAPGANILTTSKPEYSNYQNDYFYGNGTSFAAPIVSGVAALIKARYPNISNTALQNRIVHSAGGGFMVDAYEAIKQPLQSHEKVDLNKLFVDQERKLLTDVDAALTSRLKGKILLQVEDKGQAWYVHPVSGKRHYMADGNAAYQIMRDLGVGITNADLEKVKSNTAFAKRHAGKIFLQVEDKGQAYYIDQEGEERYLRNGSAAYNVMRELGLGIANADLRRIAIE